MCLLSAVIVVSGIMLISSLRALKKGDDLYKPLESEFRFIIGGNDTAAPVTSGPADSTTTTSPVVTTPPEGGEDSEPDDHDNNDVTDPEEPTIPEPNYSEKFKSIRNYLLDKQKINIDIIGYIIIDFSNTESITYPVVLGNDNEFYVTHAFDKSELKAGSIFLDCRNNANPEANRVSVIYGHNMINGSMFGKLTNFKQKKYFDNVKITLYSLYGIYTYEVFSVYNTTSDGDFSKVHFNSDTEYLSHIKGLQSKSLLSKNITLTESSRVLTLSTCINTNSTSRLAVHAVLTNIER